MLIKITMLGTDDFHRNIYKKEIFLIFRRLSVRLRNEVQELHTPSAQNF